MHAYLPQNHNRPCASATWLWRQKYLCHNWKEIMLAFLADPELFACDINGIIITLTKGARDFVLFVPRVHFRFQTPQRLNY